MCLNTTIDDIFVDKSDILMLTFDEILVKVIDWKPLNVGAAKHSIVFTNRKAWLIVKPMAKTLDVKFYHGELLQHPRIKKIQEYNNKFAIHLRVDDPAEIDEEFLQLLRKGYEYSMQ